MGAFLLGFGAIVGAQAGSSGLLAGLGVVGLLFGLVMFVITLLATYVVPAAITNFATKDSFGTGAPNTSSPQQVGNPSRSKAQAKVSSLPTK